MTGRWSSALAILLFAIAMIELIIALVLTIASGSFADVLQSDRAFFSLAFASAAIVGLLLTTHRPNNPIGWIFLVASVAQMNIAITDGYAAYAARLEGGAPQELTALYWASNWSWSVAFFVPITFGFLLFPTGRLPSKRWRAFAWIGASQLFLLTLAAIVRPGPIEDIRGPYEIPNPTGVEALRTQIEVASVLAISLVLLFIVGSAASLFIRLRSATPQERQQLKWLAYAASITVASFLISPVQSAALSTTVDIGWYILLIGVIAQPIAIGIAILKHNLYDIDRLINRTLVYGSLTALLLLGFAANVLLFQLILEPFTRGNDLAVAGSTLLVFALFRPLRDRLQRFVDRRFYRQRYDAQRTLQSFGVTARDAVDLDQLSTELTGVISTTIQPAHVSIWLRAETARKDHV